MKLRSEQASEEARIEIIPLIDVIFCILTFFILAALGLTRQSTIGLDLPRASTGSTEMRNMLIVSIDPIGQTYIERTPVTRDQLLDAMFDFQATDPTGTVVLYASRSASYNDVVEVLDLLRSVGGDRVGLATLPDSSSVELTDPSAIPTDVPAPGFDLNSDPFQLPGAPSDLPPTDSGTVPGDDLVFPGLNDQPPPGQNGTN